MCTLCQIRNALTSFCEWSVPDSGSPHTIKGKVCVLLMGDDHCSEVGTKPSHLLRIDKGSPDGALYLGICIHNYGNYYVISHIE